MIRMAGERGEGEADAVAGLDPRPKPRSPPRGRVSSRGPVDRMSEWPYPVWIREFLDVQLLMESHAGFPAFEDEPVREGVVRAGAELLVLTTRVVVDQRKPATARFEPWPFLWFLITGREDREQELRLDSFVVDVEMALEALAKADPSTTPTGHPVPAYLATEPDTVSVEAGDARYLTMKVVELERPSPALEPPRMGIRFEIAEGEDHPLYSFTMEGLTAFLALGVPILEQLPAPDRRSSFSRELDELSERIESSWRSLEEAGGGRHGGRAARADRSSRSRRAS